MDKKNWLYNEFKQVGTDYNDLNEIKAYDNRMQLIRDLKKEKEIMLQLLNPKKSDVILEIGSGTGEFTIELAKKSKKVVALDVSKGMIDYAELKLNNLGIKNVEFIHNGFLTFDLKEDAFDIVYSSIALHHLPDFWKLIALKKIHRILKKNGYFYLRDVIYSFNLNNYIKCLDSWIERSNSSKESVIRHISDEYSTTSSIMEIIIKESGFSIEKKKFPDDIYAIYLCKK